MNSALKTLAKLVHLAEQQARQLDEMDRHLAEMKQMAQAYGEQTQAILKS